jgi:hypothetical protein
MVRPPAAVATSKADMKEVAGVAAVAGTAGMTLSPLLYEAPSHLECTASLYAPACTLSNTRQSDMKEVAGVAAVAGTAGKLKGIRFFYVEQ